MVVCRGFGEAASASAVDEDIGEMLYLGRGGTCLAGGSPDSRTSLPASRLAGPAMVTSPIALSLFMELESSSHVLMLDVLDASSPRSSSVARTFEFFVAWLRFALLRSFVVPVL